MIKFIEVKELQLKGSKPFEIANKLGVITKYVKWGLKVVDLRFKLKKNYKSQDDTYPF